MASAHAKCAGYKTFSEAAASNNPFFCAPCDNVRKTGAPRPSPIKPSQLTRQSVNCSTFPVPAPTSPIHDSVTPKDGSSTSPLSNASHDISSCLSPSGSIYSTTIPSVNFIKASSPIASLASPILDSQQTLHITAGRRFPQPIPVMPDLSIHVTPNGRPQESLSQVDDIPEIQPHYLDHDYNLVPSLMSLNIPQPTSTPPASTLPFHPDLPPLDDVMETHIFTLEHIPKACRNMSAAILSSLLHKAVNDPSLFNY